MPRRVIKNKFVTVPLPEDLVTRYEAISRQCDRALATTLRNVLAATVEEAEAAGRKLYKFNREEDNFDELAGQADENDDDVGGRGGEEGGSSPGTQAEVGGGVEHPARSEEEEDTEVSDGGVDDGAAEDGGEPSAPAAGRPRGRKYKKGR